MYGRIKWFKENKGYGYIDGADDETYFFELNDCLNTAEVFNSGDKVLFIPNNKGIDFASSVEKVIEG